MFIKDDISLMFIKDDISLRDFKFWSGAKEKAVLFTAKEMATIENILIDLYPDGIDGTKLNDLFWFGPEMLCEWVGITEEELFERETA